MENAEQYMQRISKRGSDIREITGENPTVQEMQIAELYLETEDLRKSAYHEIERLKSSMTLTRWAILGAIAIYHLLFR